MTVEFVVSGDAHIIEPVDLFKQRLPKNLRDRALWEEEFVLDEPLSRVVIRCSGRCTVLGLMGGRCRGIGSSRGRRRMGTRTAFCVISILMGSMRR